MSEQPTPEQPAPEEPAQKEPAQEEPTQEQIAAQRKEAFKARRAGQTAITLFVVFIGVAALAFGNAPATKVAGPGGTRLNVNVISCLGIGLGVLAMLFLMTSFERILRLSSTRKVLGLVGSAGLIAHAGFALLWPISLAGGPAMPAGTAGFQPLDVRGAEQWVIDGNSYNIASTYYLKLPKGLQFTIEYPYRFTGADANMSDGRALEIAMPLMQYACRKGLYKRTSVSKLGKGDVAPSRIGVVLVEKRDGRARGYRVALDLRRIEKRMATQPAGE